MRLLRIAVKNLNSLYGEHEVDIERGLGGAPLFLIMGPTGAGKSTLMDAVSLALFGQTPRLQQTSSTARPDEDARNVMSHGTGEAQAQVDVQKVENGKEVRYRATWTCRRARLKPDGNFQHPKRCLDRSEDGGQTWTNLVDEDREKFFGPEFERFLEGLMVTDFKRSMLLAQGEFSAFLKADEQERANILERLTDTSMYRALGERAAQRKREAEDEKRKAEAALGSVQLLSPEEESETRAELERARGAAAALKKRLEAVTAALAWRQRLGELDGAIEKLGSDERQVAQQWEQHKREFDALDEHTRCAPAAEALTALDAARAAHSKKSEALPGLRDAEAASLEAARSAESKEELAAAAVTERTRELETISPEIAQARTLKNELQSARSELTSAESKLKERALLVQKERKALAVLETTVASAQRALELAEQTLAKCADAKPLVEALAGLKAQASALGSSKAALEAKRKSVAADQKKVASLRMQLQELKAKAELLAPELERQSRAETDAAAALSGVLGDSSDEVAFRAALVSKQESIELRLRKLDDAERLIGEKRERFDALEQLRTAVREAQARAEEAARAIALIDERVEVLEAAIQERKIALEDQRLLQSYAKGRSDLKPGKECPLCGGTDHPFMQDPKFAELDKRVEARCAELEAANQRDEEEQKKLQKDRAAKVAAKAAADGERETWTKRGKADRALFDRCERALAEALAGAGCTEEEVAASKQEANVAAAECKKTLQRLDDAIATLRSARDAVQKARHELEKSHALCAEREKQLAADAERVEDLEGELGVETSRVTAEEQGLLEAFAGFGLDASKGASAAIADAQERVKALRDAEQVQTSAQAKLSEVKLAASAAAAKCAEMEAQLGPAAAELEQRRAGCEALAEKLGGLLGGEDPDVVERRLVNGRDAAAESLKRATAELNRARVALATAETQRRECEQVLAELQKSRDEAQTRLEAAMRPLGIGDEQALRARLLSMDERARIAKRRSELEKKLEQVRTLLVAQQAAREEHLGRRPATEEELPEELAPLKTLQSEVESQHRAEEKTAVLAAEKLRNQDLLRDRLGALQKVLEEKRAELDVWARLHGLIGVGDGEGFKRFAQTLNLGELIARANAHLERLAPRYKLVGAKTPKGESRLAFAVQDAFHAGESRPVNTLSGGESFLVSLALALALASYRTVKMPIETLLLDEGFGTLDPETLQVAMAALEALNASGTQVGIISHVEALKERIPARVVVSQTGSGRSQVRVEVGFGAPG